MKRPWAVWLIAAVSVGCRPAQPATNPFLRTTVPPPGTGQGAVVVPGEPYYPPPQGVPGAQPPAVAPAVPVAPPVAAPPVVAPPSDNRYAPPGGSFQYNQSSLEPSKSSADAISAKALAQQNPAEEDTVQQAVLLSSEADPVTPASYRETKTARQREPTRADARSTPPELAVNGENDVGSPDNTLRILGSPPADRDDAVAEQSIEATPVIHVTVGESPRRDSTEEAPFQEVRRTIADSTVSQVAIVSSDPVSDSTQAQSDGLSQGGSPSGEGGERQAAGGQRTDYAFAPDYAWLRGRLEYSQSSRQWKLRYIPIDGETDQFGGSVVLPNSPALEAFQPGDRVAVRGSLAAHSFASGIFSPLYKFDQVQALTP